MGLMETTPTNRFNINTADGTIYDSKTKLTWKLCAEGQNYDGRGRCNGDAIPFTSINYPVAIFGDKGDGWRMPNVDELASLIEKRCKLPAVNLMVFPDLPKIKSFGEYTEWSVFWSASDYSNGELKDYPWHASDSKNVNLKDYPWEVRTVY